jgi:FtsP/CotA-like multicopper oxidase with cupredoxin domain
MTHPEHSSRIPAHARINKGADEICAEERFMARQRTLIERVVVRSWVACVAMLGMLLTVGHSTAQTNKSVPECGYVQDVTQLIARYGKADFQNPREVRPVDPLSELQLTVQYGDNVLLGCPVHLRSYGGRLVGDTIRAKPGDVLFIRVKNDLPPRNPDPSPENQMMMSHHGGGNFNITNLHTHGLHTDPVGSTSFAGDNVLIELEPGQSQEYRIRIPDDHPAGTFWYHAHFHGSTAIQLASGMAGALIIEGGTKANGDLDVLPDVKRARPEEKVFVLQQLDYDTNGELESFDDFGIARNWQRHITINGQFVPTIRMRPGEVQRWRFVDAGTAEYMTLNLDGHKLYEVAADGISLGRMVPWPAAKSLPNGLPGDLFLAPGYRSDVLVKANALALGESSHEYFLRDTQLSANFSLQARFTAAQRARQGVRLQQDLNAIIPGKPEQIIARILVEGAPDNMNLPTDDQLRDVVPSALRDIAPSDLTGTPQTVNLDFDERICDKGDCSKSCSDGDAGCDYRAMIDDHVFDPHEAPRLLELNTASQWTVLSGDKAFAHPFHIHVNPFQVDREEPNAQGDLQTRTVWKDTMIVPFNGSPITLKARYTDYIGTFVLHCHILGHEDMGMMQLVKINPPKAK